MYIFCILITLQTFVGFGDKQNADEQGTNEQSKPSPLVKEADEEKPQIKSPNSLLTFKPPMRGAPLTRIGGGVRGPDLNSPILRVITPQSTGLTLSAQPILYWFQSKLAPDMQCEFVLNSGEETLVQETLEIAKKPGIQKLDLKYLDVHLEPEVEYEWNIALIPDPQRRTMDVVASGTIQKVKASEELMRQLAQADSVDLPAIYCNAGIWYEAISSLSTQIEEDPESRHLREVRIGLLDQVGLSAVSEYEREGLEH